MSLDFKDLPDYPFIEKIAEGLWANPIHGYASVMIGAGYSKNAIKYSEKSLAMPSLIELGDKLCDELYSNNKLSESDYEKMKLKKKENIVKLVSEYESSFGRLHLNSFITREINDNLFKPSELHKMLLRLPWADVFTTNYDTLLERATEDIIERKYDVIYIPNDIPQKMQPRIIKLHGSFPSNLPFIITEEDFRTYPQKYAPFVNMVQQSMMETNFCLLGFSGNDPNFLAWRGWVKDNLGDCTPHIYLCGLFSYTNSERKLIEDNFIKIIDFSPIFPKSDYNNEGERHYCAIEWFLKTLESLKPVNPLKWPFYNLRASK